MPRRMSTALVLVVMAALLGACAPSVEQLQEDRDVAALAEVLASHTEAEVRADAAAALGAIGDADGADALVAALSDPEASVRRAAAGALGSLRDPATVEALGAALGDADPDVRVAAVASLDRIADDADPSIVRSELLAIFGVGSTDDRIAAARLLGTSGIGDLEALGPLLDGVDDADAGVQAAAADAAALVIEELGTASDQALIVALTDGGPNARALAARSLAASVDPAAVEPLLMALGDEDAGVRDAAAGSLSSVLVNLPDPVAVQSLVTAIRELPEPASAAAKERFEEVLVAMGPQRAVAALSTVEVGDRWLAIALGVPESDLAAALSLGGIRLDSVADIEAVAAAVAGGEPSAATAAYDGSESFHPTMYFVQEGTALSRPGLDLEWEPMATRFLELVVVQDEINWQQIQECPYNGPSIIRYRGTQTVRVLAARDGSLVASRAFQGTDPRACQPTEDYWLTELYGEDPDLAGITEWLESIVHPPTP